MMRSAPTPLPAITAASPTVPQPITATDAPGPELGVVEDRTRAGHHAAPDRRQHGERQRRPVTAYTLRALTMACVAKDDCPTKLLETGPLPSLIGATRPRAGRRG